MAKQICTNMNEQVLYDKHMSENERHQHAEDCRLSREEYTGDAPELQHLVAHPSIFVRLNLVQGCIERGKNIPEAICHDPAENVRHRVASAPEYCCLYVHDPSPWVREAAASATLRIQGKPLWAAQYSTEAFAKDESPRVRAIVAGAGYCHEQYAADPCEEVREMVAKRCNLANKALCDKLLDDESSKVRSWLARRGYGLDKLLSDDDTKVRAEAERFVDKYFSEKKPQFMWLMDTARASGDWRSAADWKRTVEFYEQNACLKDVEKTLENNFQNTV